jgi:LEA14-like dessication related protein
MFNKKSMTALRPFHLLILIIAWYSIFSSCSVYQTISNISRLKYKIYSATDYKLVGIAIANKKSLKDFNSIELLKITSGIVRENLPLTFLLNVEAKNPNDGNSGFERADLNIASFPWRLYLNDKEIVQGNIEQPVFVPGKGESVIIPIKIEFDIAKSFKEKSVDNILLLLLQIGGVHGSTSNLKMIAKPVLGTPFGKLEYPDEITIVDKSFN